jgi:hypothetical protein
MIDPNSFAAAVGPVVAALERLGVQYYVGGSVASSFHGASRSTLDIDVCAELDDEKARRLVEELALVGDDYYFNPATLLDAVQRKSCFNLIHLPSSFKIDIFVSRGRPFDRASQDRAIVGPIGEEGLLMARVATIEDTLLAKLEWYRLGDETSERQWSDMTRVAQLHRGTLDEEYLGRSAQELGVADLLERLLNEIDGGHH